MCSWSSWPTGWEADGTRPDLTRGTIRHQRLTERDDYTADMTGKRSVCLLLCHCGSKGVTARDFHVIV